MVSLFAVQALAAKELIRPLLAQSSIRALPQGRLILRLKVSL